MTNQDLQDQLQGIGVGLRSKHYQTILNEKPSINWLEILSDNYFGEGGIVKKYLCEIAELYPIAMHGVGLSIGSTDRLNREYLKKLKHLKDLVNPKIISDHLCWVSVDGQYLHELMPLPYTEDVIDRVVQRVEQVQDYLGYQILLENVSSYMTYKHSEMTEWEFLNEIAVRSDSYILLDINNIYVSATNHGFNPTDYLNNIKIDRVKQFHLAGYTEKEKFLLDSHSAEVFPPVWDLYKAALSKFGRVPTLIEWDSNIPDWKGLFKEVKMAKRYFDEFTHVKDSNIS